jgi:hypothetical protein
LQLRDSGHTWGLLTDVWVTYNQDEAYLTDLAGNLLPSALTPLKAIERTPPRIELALAQVGHETVYIKFTEPVFGDRTNRSVALDPSDFTIAGGTGLYTPTRIESVDPLTSEAAGSREFFLTLNEPLAAEDLFSSYIAPATGSAVFDSASNAMPANDRRRVTDVALGAIRPIWATDALSIGGLRTIREFDGSGQELASSDISLEARLVEGLSEGLPTRLVYDMNVPDSLRVGDYWTPVPLFGLTENTNQDARSLNPVDRNGALRTFLLPQSDPEIAAGGRLEFQFTLGNVNAARLTDTDDPRTLAPWVLNLGTGFVPQRGNVTILNNVIYPERDENTVLLYEVGRPGMVTVTVFGLDGSVVRSLQRGRQGAGEYRLAWDGRNNSGMVVARGIYFIRVVAPGVDEYRKVIVAKD